METRLIVAYALIATIALLASGTALVLQRQRTRRRRRLRGIKDDHVERGGRRLA